MNLFVRLRGFNDNEKKIQDKIIEIKELISQLDDFDELLKKDIWEIYSNMEYLNKLQICLKLVYDIIININLFLEYKWIGGKFLINIRNTQEMNLQENEFKIIKVFYKQEIIVFLSKIDLNSLNANVDSLAGILNKYVYGDYIIYTYPKEVSEQFPNISLKIWRVFERVLPSYTSKANEDGEYEVGTDMSESEFLDVLRLKIKDEINDVNNLIQQIKESEENDLSWLKKYIDELINIYKQLFKTLLKKDISAWENLIEICINPSYLKNEINLGGLNDVIKITPFDFHNDRPNYQINIGEESIKIQNNIIHLKFKNGFDNKIWLGSKYIELIKGFTIDFFNAISNKIINILEITDSINTLYNEKTFKIKLGIPSESVQLLGPDIISSLETAKTQFLCVTLELLWICYHIDREYIIIYKNEHNNKEKIQQLINLCELSLEETTD